MQMLKNQGNEAFLFTAKYQQGFSRILSRQTGVTADLVRFGVDRAGVSNIYLPMFHMRTTANWNTNLFSALRRTSHH